MKSIIILINLCMTFMLFSGTGMRGLNFINLCAWFATLGLVNLTFYMYYKLDKKIDEWFENQKHA